MFAQIVQGRIVVQQAPSRQAKEGVDQYMRTLRQSLNYQMHIREFDEKGWSLVCRFFVRESGENR